MSNGYFEYIGCLPPGVHPGMDAVAFGIRDALAAHDIELALRPADLRDPDIADLTLQAFLDSTSAGTDAICLFVLDPEYGRQSALRAIDAGIPLVTLHLPAYPVTGSIVVPNFYHGIQLTRYLADHVPNGARVAILGGPKIIDDEELVMGFVEGVKRTGLTPLNDPFDDRYRNLVDVRGAAREPVQRLLDDHPKLEALMIFNDESLLDAMDVLEERGLAGKLPVVSRNGGDEAVALVKAGKSLATYDYGLPELGVAAGELMFECFTERNAVTSPVRMPYMGRLITRDNADTYQSWSQRTRAAELVVAE